MSSAKDEAAVRALYQELMNSWNKGSGESCAAPFAEDGDLNCMSVFQLPAHTPFETHHRQRASLAGSAAQWRR